MAIVVSHIADSFDELARRALRQAPLADLIELRLDRCGHPGKERLADFCGAAAKPVIVACPGPEAGGSFRGSADERIELFHDAAEAGVRFVDVDWRLSLELGEVKAPCHRIVSRHELEGTPEDLAPLLEEVQEVLYEGDVTKLVAHAHSCEDGLRLLSWLRTTKGVVSFCSGTAGSFTRVLAPIFGSPFTYCAPASMPGEGGEEGGEPTAPGQIRVGDLRAMLPPGGISQETAIFGVVGRPVSHSLSPRVHGMALKGARLDAVYVSFEPETLDGLLALAGDENYRGFSITAPFKREAYQATERRDESSRRSGSANTLVRDPEGWRAFDTDATAVRETLDQGLRLGEVGGSPLELPGALADTHALVLGTGGAARAAAWAVRSVGGKVTVAGRRALAAAALAEELSADWIEWGAISGLDYDVLVHATPVGSDAGPEPDASPIPEGWIRPGTLVLDAVYRPIRTPLLLAAHLRGCTAVPGGEWFVRQAIAQFKLFTQADPDEDLMRKAFEHALD